MMKYFGFSLTAMILVFAGLYLYTGSALFLYQAITLTIVEVAVSFDNAVVNAAKLNSMNAFWKKMFLTVGILVAVGFMRFYMPLEIVATIDGISLVEAYNIAISDQDRFSAILTAAHVPVAGFGGAFLMMVAFNYFADREKETHWIGIIEKPMQAVAIPNPEENFWLSVLRLVVMSGWVWGVASGLAWATGVVEFAKFNQAVLVGLASYWGVHALKEGMSKLDDRLANSKVSWLAGGFGTFVYLEVLDASFSFDGVIAAFAISKNIFVVAAGLGIGALFVRSMTIMLVERGTLTEYKYLENGAMLAILALALVMFISSGMHVPEWVTATVSVLLIGGAFWHSKLEKDAEESRKEVGSAILRAFRRG